MSYNPFSNIPPVLNAEDLISAAQNRASKVRVKSSLHIPRLERLRTLEIARVREFSRHITGRLRQTVESFPSLEHLHPFYFEMSDLLVGADRLKQALGAVYNCIAPIEKITANHVEALKLADSIVKLRQVRSAAKGRISSIVRATADNLDIIIQARAVLFRLPSIDPSVPTIVCAGFPNVGKSTLVRAISTAEPEIAYYPFTTKDIIVGHRAAGAQSLQIIDTPGILDRPMSERNEIEKKAIAALKYLANAIIFMMDASGTCGWSFEEQINLYHEVQRSFPLVPTVLVLNKVDITPPDMLELARSRLPSMVEIVASAGVGIDELIRLAIDQIDLK